MKKVFIRVSGNRLTYFLTTGKVNYEITGGLPSGCKLQSVMRDPTKEDIWILLFETKIPDDDNEIYPEVKVIEE